MGLFIGNNFPVQSNKINPEIQILQRKCKGQADIREASLLNLRMILKENTCLPKQVEERKFMQVGSYPKNIERALMAALPFQGFFSPTNTKALAEIFTKLFSLLSVEMYKVDEAGRKIERELEKLENKLERRKKFKPTVENSEKSKRLGG